MPEGLSPAEVGKEIAEHNQRADLEPRSIRRPDRGTSILLEAVILSIVAVLAAYSGFAAAKWGTDLRSAGEGVSLRTFGDRRDTQAIVTRTLDSVSFNAWFCAFSRQQARQRSRSSGCAPAIGRPSLPGSPPTRPITRTLRRARLHASVRDPVAATGGLAQPPPMPRSRPGRTPARRKTSTSATPCSWPPSCSWSGSAATSGCAARLAIGHRRADPLLGDTAAGLPAPP